MLARGVFPARYVQGPGALAAFGAEAARIGNSVLLLSDATLPEAALAGLDATGVTLHMEHVTPDCTDAAISERVAQGRALGVAAVAGFGGGKVIDLARATADALNLPMISVPSSAASDAPCSALAVVYDNSGQVVRDQFVRWNPRIVLVDTSVIAAAPARLLSAGMGDGLATYYEALACHRSGAANMASGAQPRLAMAAAELCRDTILEHGGAALAEHRAGAPGRAFEAVVEANILLSGLGFESGGVAAAHAIHHGLAELPETHHALHGEKVAFGVLVELALNSASDDEISDVARFCQSVVLPVCLSDLGIADTDAALPIITARATRDGEVIFNEPVEITPDTVRAAILRADALGQSIKGHTAL